MAEAIVSNSAVPVAVQGWTWTSSLMALLNVIVGGLFVAIVRTRPALKKIANEREASLLATQAGEMSVLRDRIAKLETKLDQKDALHDAERAVDRHRINNLQQCLDALLLLIEAAPEKATEAVTRIREMRARQLEAEALEKAAIHAAEIATKSGPLTEGQSQ